MSEHKRIDILDHQGITLKKKACSKDDVYCHGLEIADIMASGIAVLILHSI